MGQGGGRGEGGKGCGSGEGGGVHTYPNNIDPTRREEYLMAPESRCPPPLPSPPPSGWHRPHPSRGVPDGARVRDGVWGGPRDLQGTAGMEAEPEEEGRRAVLSG